MLLVCPECATSYQLKPGSLGDAGRTVRCAACQHVWYEVPRPAAAAAANGEMDAAGGFPAIRPPLDDVIQIEPGQRASVPPEPAENDVPFEPADGQAAQGFEAPYGASPPIVPAAEPYVDPYEALQARTGPDIESFAAARRPRLRFSVRRSQFKLARPGLPAAIGVLVLLIIGLIAARQQVVRYLPQTASFYAGIGLPVNLRGLDFQDIRATRDTSDSVPVLVVEGEIVATTGHPVEVPRLRFAVVNGSGKEIYAWTAQPSRTLLPPGETLPFRSRLASPPAEASGITVRFFNRRDARSAFR